MNRETKKLESRSREAGERASCDAERGLLGEAHIGAPSNVDEALDGATSHGVEAPAHAVDDHR